MLARRASLIIPVAVCLAVTPVWAPPRPPIIITPGDDGTWFVGELEPVAGGPGEIGSAFFGAIESFEIEIAGQSGPIDVSELVISVAGGALKVAGGQGEPVTWSVAGQSLSVCGSCDSTTLPAAVLSLNSGGGVTFSYLAVGSSTPATAPIHNLLRMELQLE